jgi:hypothetical protein
MMELPELALTGEGIRRYWHSCWRWRWSWSRD